MESKATFLSSWEEYSSIMSSLDPDKPIISNEDWNFIPTKEYDLNSVDLWSNLPICTMSIADKEDRVIHEHREFEEPAKIIKKRQSNNERAKKSRIRKKNYYDVMEAKLKEYEAKISTLENENEFLKHKLNLFETGNDTAIFETLYKEEDKLFEEFKEWIEKTNNMDAVNQKQNEFIDAFGSYGTEKIKMLDSCFSTIVELLVQRLVRPQYLFGGKSFSIKDYNEYERYKRMSKFEKLENYPDEMMRQQIDQVCAFDITKLQFQHMDVNMDPISIRDFNNLKNGIKLLFEAKTTIYKTLIDIDAVMRYFNPIQAKIEQLKSFLEFDFQSLKPITVERLFGISSETVQIDSYVNIADKELEKTSLDEVGCPQPENNKFTYSLTIHKID